MLYIFILPKQVSVLSLFKQTTKTPISSDLKILCHFDKGFLYYQYCLKSTHSPVFNQLEGLVIDENVSMADLKSMLTILMKRLFGEDTTIRFRPSFFPFTEPSIEVDVSCPSCHGKGCSVSLEG